MDRLEQRTDRLARGASVRGKAWAASFRSGGLLLVLVAAVAGCEFKHVPVDAVEELGYPGCGTPTADRQALGPGTTIFSGHLRSGPAHIDRSIVEHFRFARHDCLQIFTVRQDWPLGTADVEVVYDRAGRPLRMWKRLLLPGLPDPVAKAEIRRYEFRTEPVSIRRRDGEGRIDHELLKGGKPEVVIGPGRGLISIWLQREKLEPGQIVRRMAIDVRGLEKIQRVALRREEDRYLEEVGKKVRVYTFFGRESVFADENDVVLGDLAGLRPHASLKTTAPAAVPAFGPLDTFGTP